MVQLSPEFDDIRPYYDSEIPAAMERIADSPLLLKVLNYLRMEDRQEDVRSHLKNLCSCYQLQKEVMLPLCKELIERTTDGFTCKGIENALMGKGQIFVSNHRDIVLDAYLQQMAIFEHGIPTSHITFGSNLMEPQFVVDAGLSNKMFKTVRKSPNFESFMESSIHLSAYINRVCEAGESVWIAQRNGRTKDGFDKTEPGLIRMLLLGSAKREAFEHLNITPVAVSYQWEPCAALKAAELYASRNGQPYVKAKGEDLNSIIKGLIEPKGKVHIEICEPLTPNFCSNKIKRSDIARIAEDIDIKIHKAYKLWDTNYIAYDLLAGGSVFLGYYTKCMKDEFIFRMHNAIDRYNGGRELEEIYLKIFAGPVINKLKANGCCL